MEVTINEKAEFEKLIEINVPYEDLVPKFNESYVEYKKSIRLEGFRKGKVPLELVKKMFGLKIEREVAEQSASDYLEKAVEEKEVKLHDVIKIESLDYDRENGLTFKVKVRVEPDVELKKIKKLEVEYDKYNITEDDVNEGLKNLQEQHATLNNVEGGAQDGHYLVADLQKTDGSGHPLIGEKYDNRFLQLGGEGMDDDLSKQLIGVKAGETRRVALPPINEEDEEAFYSINVREIKEKKLPEIDDEFAKEISNYNNLEELKESIRENLTQQIKSANRQKFEQSLIDEVVKSNPVDLPDFMIDHYLDMLIQNLKAEESSEVDEEDIRTRFRADAIRNLKWRLIKDKIAEKEDLKVENEDVEQRVEEMIKDTNPQEKAKIRRDYKEDEKRDRLKYDVLEERVLKLLEENAKIKENDVNYQTFKKQQEMIVEE